MKAHFLLFILCICSLQTFYAQEDDGVVSLAIPSRNSLTFNRFTQNPTFSFVREQTKYISVYNKREWVQFENAPLTYLASYSGRFGENIGAGLGLFQQNYGVLTTYGGILNFAYNAQLGYDSNLTFGLNIGAYKSGVNTANVITNFSDPSLENVPENFLLTINPGINYGTEFLDFGLSINNLALYNFEASELIEDNPQQSIQAHVMYTGYMDSRGFFDESKFTGLLRSEFQKEETILSAVAMVTVPKGIWAQAGYNTLYGASGGVGLNITTQIAIEYNYETAFGDLSNYGPSHEITLAYRFKNDNYYNYSREDEVSSILSSDGRRKRRVTKPSNSSVASRNAAAENKAKAEADAEAKLEAEQEAQEKIEADKEAERLAIELKEQQEAEAQAKLIEAQKLKDLEEAKAKAEKIEADKKAAERAETRAKLQAEQKAKEEAAARARLLAEQKAEEEAAAQAKLLAEQKAEEEAAAQAKLLEEQKAAEEAAAQAKLLAEQKAEEEAAAQAKLLAEQKAAEEAAAQAKLLAEQKAKEEAAAQAKLLAEQKAEEEAAAQAKLLAEQKAEEEAAAQAKLLAEQKAEEAAAAQAKLVAEQKAEEEAAAQAILLAEQKAEEEAAQVKENAISNATDELAVSMQTITKSTEASKTVQNELLEQFDEIVAIKDQDLKDMKEENDLSDQGITVQPKPFKSVTAENNALRAIRTDLDDVIKTRTEKIDELNKLYEERAAIGSLALDEVTLFYEKEIKRLKAEQLKAKQAKAQLDVRLEAIQVATEFEKRRRIKRAAFNNEDDRYSQGRAKLKNIRETTKLSATPLKAEDFDFGEAQGNSIKILKNINHIDSGFYLIIAVHGDEKSRDEFLTKVVASGRTNVDFFHDVNTSKYYIYYDKVDDIASANRALEAKGNRPYNGKMSIVKIENQ
ncbi:PorP/SprF family type IX secretion system membrane protein [Winogradskyella sp. F6397]|uniref:PorP/SprF family type IX secretion system membrane protein n=1 Tax=Winogradskyella marina TaxID=2785530 RepID=A0ABS0EK58_9FLAO|nr:PorP/SprF family type IX secretion system membrane protein [Winogradskyella marina]MBF8150648.1 PorP/SprF family type IX secretion system membrane protein [Winogradskyella marina]